MLGTLTDTFPFILISLMGKVPQGRDDHVITNTKKKPLHKITNNKTIDPTVET